MVPASHATCQTRAAASRFSGFAPSDLPLSSSSTYPQLLYTSTFSWCVLARGSPIVEERLLHAADGLVAGVGFGTRLWRYSPGDVYHVAVAPPTLAFEGARLHDAAAIEKH